MSQNVPIQSFKLAEEGLTHIFGELEARLMEAVWALEQASVQDVIDYLGDNLNYKTTMTVLNRMTAKGILERHKLSRAYIYTATSSKENLLASVFDRMVRGMFDDDFRKIALTQLVETAEAIDPGLLDDISHLIAQRKENAQDT